MEKSGWTKAALTAGALSVLALVFIRPTAGYAFPRSLSGNIQLTGTSSEAAGVTRESVDQRYALTWNRRVSPYLSLRAGVTYDRFGTNLGEGGNIWRRQLQPTAGIQWSHPVFTLFVNAQRREATTNNRRTDLIRNSYGVSLVSKASQYPTATIRYGFDEAYNDFDRALRDTREHQLQSNLSHSFAQTTLKYVLTRRDFDNVSSNLKTDETAHQLRWLQSNRFFDGQLSFNADYAFNHRRHTSRLIGADTTVRGIDIVAALYAPDATPDLGALDTVGTLADGLTEEPTDPVIDIGRGVTDQNIGVDFGFVRSARGLYIYTDNPSGSALGWELYHSTDNLVWSRIIMPIRVEYNTAFRRYEIFFETITARYLKAVNRGENEVLNVSVTEIEALEEIASDEEQKRSQTAHNMDFGISYNLAEKIRATSDINFRRESKGDFSNSRNRLYYGFSLYHNPSSGFIHSARFQTGWDEFSGTTEKDQVTALSYTLQVRPLETMEFVFSALTRNNSLGETPFQETNNIFLRANTTLLRDLQVRLETGYSRNNQFVAKQKFDTWTGRSTVNSVLLPNLEFSLSGLYQTTKEPGPDPARIRRTLTAMMDYRLTGNMNFRGTVTIGDDHHRDYLSQDYTFFWRMSPKLSFSTVLIIIDSDSAARSERRNIRLNYKISTRAYVYTGYTGTDTGNGAGSGIDSFQFGFQTGF